MFDFDILLQQILNGLVLGSVYALIALGYTMVYGILQLINFAHGEVLMIGAMVAAWLVPILLAAGVPAPVVLLIVVLAAIPVCMALSITIERLIPPASQETTDQPPSSSGLGPSRVRQIIGNPQKPP